MTDFNCTIQELKPEREVKKIYGKYDFNCTIQELKQGKISAEELRRQLISIAPYRN